MQECIDAGDALDVATGAGEDDEVFSGQGWLRSASDAGVSALLPLKELQQLSLARTAVTDAAVPTLAKLQSLRGLDLRETQVGRPGIAELQKALPKCLILP